MCPWDVFTLFKSDPEVMLEELAGKQLGGTAMAERMHKRKLGRKTFEAIASTSILTNNWTQMLSDTCSMRKRSTGHELVQFLRHHGLLLW